MNMKKNKSKLYYRLNSLCTFLKQEKLIQDYEISHLKLNIDEKKIEFNYEKLLLKFENDNKILKEYIDYFILFNDALDKKFMDKYKSFIDEYEEEQIKIMKQLKQLTDKEDVSLSDPDS